MFFISFQGYLLEIFPADIETFKFTVDGCVMDGNEAVGCQEIQKLVQEVVWVVMNELKEIVKIFMIKMADTASDALLFKYNVARFLPEPPDLEPGMMRKATAIKDVLEVKQFTFIDSV